MWVRTDRHDRDDVDVVADHLFHYITQDIRGDRDNGPLVALGARGGVCLAHLGGHRGVAAATTRCGEKGKHGD